MPIFEFTSPDGTKYHGEGATPEDAFRTAAELAPNEIAAMRQRQAVKPSRGRGESDFTGQVEDFLVPGLGAVKSAAGGDFAEAAGKAALSAAPYGLGRVPAAAKALGAGAATALAPSATAGGMFDAEPDPKVRRSLQRQYDEAGPKGKAEITKAFMEQQGKIAGEKRAAERETEARGLTKKTRDDWFAQNADAIKSLKPQWQQQIQAAGSLPEAQEMFNRGMEERRKAGMTFAEAYPPLVTGLETAGIVAAAALPYRTAAKRSATLKGATSDAYEAFKAAWGSGARKSKGREAEAALAENILKETKKMWPVSPIKAVGEASLPWIFSQAPNFLDVTLGRLDSDPAAKEKVQRAWDNILSLGPVEQALLEGAAGVTAGTLFGMGGTDWLSTQKRARGVLNTYEGRRTAVADAAKAAADRKAAAVAARQPRPKPRLVENTVDPLKPGGGSVLNADFESGGGYGH